MSRFYIIQKDGHRYDFNNVKGVRTEFTQNGMVEVLVISGQFLPRQRYKDVRILPQTIKETNINDVKIRLMKWLS